MESFFVRYRNLLLLLVLLLVQIIGLAMQVRKNASGRISYDTADKSGVRLLRLWANWIVSPPERAVQTSKSGVGSIWEEYFYLRDVRRQNKQLQETIDRLRLEQAALLEDARQGERLQADLKFQQRYIYKTVLGQVIGTSGSDQSKVFYIDKGKEDGLARDMAVITPTGIVGKIRDVFPHTSQVLAINDQTSGAGVILESTRIRGILRGNALGQPQIVGVLQDQRIKPGEKVLTAGGDQIFPRGLPVGEVEKIRNDPDRDGFIQVIVKPSAQLYQLDEVLVITATEDRFSQQQSKDMATSESLKAADLASLAEQRKASQIMAERLPGLTDPNTPAAATQPGQTAANGQAAAAGQAAAPGQAAATGQPVTPAIPGQPPGAAVVPKVLPPAHSDRFTPGRAAGAPDEAGPSRPTPEQQKPTPEQKKMDAPRRNPPRPEIVTPSQSNVPGTRKAPLPNRTLKPKPNPPAGANR